MDAEAGLSMPLFPLRTVLFPGGLLPLQIFELRYLDMIARRHRAGAPFGVVCLTEGSEVRRPAAEPGGDGFAHEAFHPIGTLARIDELQRPRPGLLLVRCTGTQRFRVLRSAQQKFGLWVAEVEPIADDALVPVPDDLGFAREALVALLRELERDADAAELPMHPPYRWDDCGWLANRWCELLPIDATSKQRFMAIDSPLLRLELVADTLRQMGLARPGD
ncbi:MAG TPA: LON peptidase substrate-binding domain-containing protein [Burkholderiaceae bacterium]|nr:LON peptidase substrate-binding domain-containing protein [Burkholderiaceae bacterium]